MEIRKLSPQEYYESDTISRTCFHVRFSGSEQEERAKAQTEREDWGAFDGNGKLMAHIINNHYSARLNGEWVPMGGIGAVSTLPEYRSSSAIREIFKQLLPERRRAGETISCLYPFKHAFYRKFGYETVTIRNVFEFKPAALRNYRFEGKAVQFEAGQPVEAYRRIHELFVRNFNLTVARGEDAFKHGLLCDAPLSERKFAYLLSEGAEDIAYLCFTDQRAEPAAKLIVTDCAWTDPRGFRAILGFLARFEADYGFIELSVPTDMNLELILPHPYEIEAAKLTGHYMLRVVNVPEALRSLVKYAGNGFSVKVYGDEIIEENNGIWFVGEQGVQLCDKAADIELSLHALNQLICGAMDLKTALFRNDVHVQGNASMLHGVFRARPAFLTDHF